MPPKVKSIYYLVGQGEKVVGCHEGHTEEGGPLQIEGFGCECGGEGSDEDGPGQALHPGTEAEIIHYMDRI